MSKKSPERPPARRTRSQICGEEGGGDDHDEPSWKGIIRSEASGDEYPGWHSPRLMWAVVGFAAVLLPWDALSDAGHPVLGALVGVSVAVAIVHRLRRPKRQR